MADKFEVQVRWADLDVLNHVNNVRLLEFLQEARVHFFRDELGGDYESGAIREQISGFGLVVARQEVDYLRSIVLEDRLVTIETSVERIGRSSFSVLHDLCLPDGTQAARGRVVLVCIDPQTGSSTALPESWRSRLEPRLSGAASETTPTMAP